MITPGTNAEIVKELLNYHSLNLLAGQVNMSLDVSSRTLIGERPSHLIYCKLRYYFKRKFDS